MGSARWQRTRVRARLRTSERLYQLTDSREVSGSLQSRESDPTLVCGRESASGLDMWECVYVRVCLHIRTHMPAHVYICMLGLVIRVWGLHISLCVRVCVVVCVRVCVCVCVCGWAWVCISESMCARQASQIGVGHILPLLLARD